MQAILHIGTEKTGTTSIQEFLVKNADLLRQQGVALLTSPVPKNNWKLATYAMDPELVDDLVITLGIEDPAERKRWREEFRHELTRELMGLGPEIHTVIISSEHLHSRLPHERDISRLHNLLSGFFNDFKVIVYLRRQDRLVTSSQSTALKAGGEGFQERAQKGEFHTEDHYFNPEISLNRWKNVFGARAIVPRVYAKQHFYKKSLFADFLQAVQLLPEELELEYPPRLNMALTADALEVLRSFNSRFPSLGSDEVARRNTRLRLQLVRKLEREHPGNPDILTREQATTFYGQFKPANDRVAREWFGRDTLFDEDFSMYPDSIQATLVNRSLMDSLMGFLDEVLSTPSRKFAPLNDASDRGEALRNLALQCEQSDPEVARLLMDEVRAHYPPVPDRAAAMEENPETEGDSLETKNRG